MRVLAADDDAALLRVLERQLRTWGYEPTVAHNGIEAWRILKREDAPRVVILDWDMPGLAGLEVCRLLRSTAHGADAYVLMLTGRLEKEDLVQALESGADDFLSKPFHARELQLRLAKGVRDSVVESSVMRRAAPDTPPSGSILGGKYRLEKKIGEGGMGSVWLGVHLALGINVAIKFASRDVVETADHASFEREARAAAQLRNEHIVRVYDHGFTRDGLPYLVMEYLAGETLAAWVERLGPLSPSAVASLVEQTARALAEAHERGLVHRDVKPENILMIEDADRPHGFAVKLIDFGLAKPWRTRRAGPVPSGTPSLVPDSSIATSMTGGSVVAGTPVYMSPECLSSSASPSPLLDLWGLGVTAFLAMTGVLPFEGEGLVQLYERVCVEPLPIPSEVHPGVPVAFDAWFARACARDPDARFAGARELAAALSAACGGIEGRAESAPRLAKGFGSFAPTEPESRVSLATAERPRGR